MLTLSIRKKWFDMILDGSMKEVYFDIKPYYIQRFQKEFEMKDDVPTGNNTAILCFTNGYGKWAPSFYAECKLKRLTGNPECGTDEGKEYYVLQIDDIFNVHPEAKKEITQQPFKNNQCTYFELVELLKDLAKQTDYPIYEGNKEADHYIRLSDIVELLQKMSSKFTTEVLVKEFLPSVGGSTKTIIGYMSDKENKYHEIWRGRIDDINWDDIPCGDMPIRHVTVAEKEDWLQIWC